MSEVFCWSLSRPTPAHTADQKTGGSKMFAAGKKRPFSTWPASQEKTEKGSEKV